MAETLTLNSTNSVRLKGLRNTDTNAYPVDAAVVLTGLYDSLGVLVTGTAAIAMPYASGIGRLSIYRGAIPSTVTLVLGASYTAKITATSGANVRVFNVDCVALAG